MKVKASGNSEQKKCVENLLKTFRSEVPYSRIKGLDPRNLDKPADIAHMEVEADALWLIDTYEPRVSTDDIETVRIKKENGEFAVIASIRNTE